MIKFIATDLDGTLLDESNDLPDEIFDVVEQLNKNGILFSPASGRQYANLKRLFAPVQDKVLFICENGALVKYRGETLFKATVEESAIKPALDAVRAVPWGRAILCGENTAFIEDFSEPFYTMAKKAYTSCVELSSLDEAIGREGICKISVFDAEGKAEEKEKYLRKKIPALQTVVSGKYWCDVTTRGVNKGLAIRALRERLNLNKDEIIGFGDHMNDYEMLLECGSAYITENGYAPLKKEIGNVIPSNRDGGVIKFLKAMLL